MIMAPVRNEQICSRSVLTKTDQLQTTLSSAESVFSLLQTLSLNTLRDVNTADARQTNNRSADYLQGLCKVRMRTADADGGRRTADGGWRMAQL